MNSRNTVDSKDIMIASLRKQLQEALQKNSAMEQEIALQENEIIRLKRIIGDHKNTSRT
jgi:hypothetical protein